jgi:hypothetical protein
MGKSGFTEAPALEIVAKIWRPIEMGDHFTWGDLHKLNVHTLEELESGGLLKDGLPGTCSTIANEWPFPLHSLNLKVVRVDKRELQLTRESWTPEL